MSGCSGDYKDDGDDSDECDAIPTASRRQLAVTDLERFDPGTVDVDRYEGEACDNAHTDEEKESSQADDGSMHNVEDWGHCRCDLKTSEVDRYEGEDGDDADTAQQEDELPDDDGSMQNVDDWGHSTSECEDWRVYFRTVKYNIGEANAKASNVSNAKTVL